MKIPIITQQALNKAARVGLPNEEKIREALRERGWLEKTQPVLWAKICELPFPPSERAAYTTAVIVLLRALEAMPEAEQ